MLPDTQLTQRALFSSSVDISGLKAHSQNAKIPGVITTTDVITNTKEAILTGQGSTCANLDSSTQKSMSPKPALE